MPGIRNHEPFIIESFNGLWARGDDESVPSDHFITADNIQFFHSGFKTRDPIDKYQGQAYAVGQIVRTYTYVMQSGESLLVLTSEGKIYHCIGESTVYGPILSIATMTDFGFVAIAGRAYITPFTTVNGVSKGLQNEYVYVYKGDGTNARKAAGFPPTNSSTKPFIAFNSPKEGAVTKGVHLIAVSYNGGALGPEVYPVVEAPGDQQIQVSNIPIGPVGTASRTIAMTRAVDPKDYTADPTGQTFYTVETINDNTTTSIKINTADAALVTAYVAGPTMAPATSALLVENTDNDGHCDFGFHIIGVVYETDTGYLTAPGPEYFGAMSFVDVKKAVKITNIPTSPSPYVTKRHLVSTKWIPEYNGDQKGFQFFFIPDGTIENNTATELEVSYYDSDLLSDASHLIDNFSEIPAFVGLNTYRGRMVGWAEYDNISVLRASAPGEPEAINQVDGLIIVPLDGNPITNAQEFRDTLYVFKQTRTHAYSDNNDEPAAWIGVTVDQGVGAPVHGIATVLDSGGVSVDYLLIANYSGMILFNGTFSRPELSWKIEDEWNLLDRTYFHQIQIVNDAINKKAWMTLPTPYRHKLLHMDYANGMDPKNVRFAFWVFDINISALTIMNVDKLIIGALENK